MFHREHHSCLQIRYNACKIDHSPTTNFNFNFNITEGTQAAAAKIMMAEAKICHVTFSPIYYQAESAGLPCANDQQKVKTV